MRGHLLVAASEDGKFLVYDLKNSRSMEILKLCLYGLSADVVVWSLAIDNSEEVLETIELTTDYLKCLTVVTGSEFVLLNTLSELIDSP